MTGDLLFIAGGVALVLFVFVVGFGAPYLPTLTPQIKVALDLIDLKPGETLLELGSGDGRVLVAAAERDLKVIGYELNPLLVLFSKLRTRKYKGQVRVVWGNFWRKPLPPAEGIFVFLLNGYMKKLDRKILAETKKPVKLVSFAFDIPGRKPHRHKQGIFLYKY